MATPVSRKLLVAIGTCFGKFTGSGVFLLHITCLDYLAQFAKVRRRAAPSADGVAGATRRACSTKSG